MTWSRESGQKSTLCCVVLKQETLELRDWPQSHSPASCHSYYLVYSLFPGLFPCAFWSLCLLCSHPHLQAHSCSHRLGALGLGKDIFKCTKIPVLFPLSNSTQTLQPCLAPTPSYKSRNWNFLLFSPPHNPQFLVCDILQPEITVPNLPQYLQLGKPFLILFSAGDISQVESKEMLKLAKRRPQQAFVACWLNL